MSGLPLRIRGPRGKADRKAGGYEPLDTLGYEAAAIERARQREAKKRSQKHRDFVRDHDCIVLGCTGRPIEVMHVRLGTPCGVGEKPSDRWTVSGCRDHHSEQHRIGEASFETKYGVDLKVKAAAFVSASPVRKLLESMA